MHHSMCLLEISKILDSQTHPIPEILGKGLWSIALSLGIKRFLVGQEVGRVGI